MEAAGYGLLLPHRAEHEHMIERSRALVTQFSAPDSPPLDRLADGFLVMFLSHIKDVDMDYVDFLKQREPVGRSRL